MQVTYINHSCFLIENKNRLLLFDYFDGTLPELNADKPLYCFASHSHHDHFSSKLFDVTSTHPSVHYILSDDIFKSNVPAELAAYTDFIAPRQTIVIDNLSISTLKSTDKGVAFIVNADGSYIYHAGDLNNWQWDDEDDRYNKNMEIAYTNEIKKLTDIYFKLAFVPYDSRQSRQIRQKGIKIFSDYVNAQNIFPMHMWDKYDITDELINEADTEIANIFRITKFKGEAFLIEED